jgi:hypothetical protein
MELFRFERHQSRHHLSVERARLVFLTISAEQLVGFHGPGDNCHARTRETGFAEYPGVFPSPPTCGDDTMLPLLSIYDPPVDVATVRRTFPKTFKCAVGVDKLIGAGFQYCGPDDKVQCLFCRGRLYHWRSGNNPMKLHRKHYPHCPFVIYRRRRRNTAAHEDAPAAVTPTVTPPNDETTKRARIIDY